MIVRVVVESDEASDKAVGPKTIDKFPDNGDGKSVRKAALAVLIEKGQVPADAKIGWLTNRGRRKGCSPEAHLFLDAINNAGCRAYSYYKKFGKQSPKRGQGGEQPHLFVSYLRVSTREQWAAKVGLERQRSRNIAYIKMCGGKLLKEYTEAASGRKKDRPEVMEAIRHCEATGATLIVETVDRLARNVHFVTGVQESNFPLIIATEPNATPERIVELAIYAQYKADQQNQITRDSLAISRKPKGVKGTENLWKNPEAVTKGRMRGAAAMKSKADKNTMMIMPYLQRYQDEGTSTFTAMAMRLNADQVLTARGKRGGWTGQAVKNLLARADALAPQGRGDGKLR
ncbi:recombinase family protein [Geomonas subterranea]|uniref:Recombinase family protein n=1 Tax=Geomonas subterranea TaxID=2847989 RepID=A0ABX8LKJ8_9BACT|nr:recombinase family protein [Geomonas subterranea]QXE92555.1 recombinase family protein [Geomonas subterranea]QXM09347.1 recombinase family protein [Geomonas subterranea]